jgi:hypothetical protein
LIVQAGARLAYPAKEDRDRHLPQPQATGERDVSIEKTACHRTVEVKVDVGSVQPQVQLRDFVYV